MLREETSSRASVRRSMPMVSRTSQSLRCSSMTASAASTGSAIARGLQQQQAELQFVDAQHQDRVVEFARHRQRPPLIAGGVDRVDRLRLRRLRARARSSVTVRARAVERHVHVLVVIAVVVDRALERRQLDAFGVRPDGSSLPASACACAAHQLRKLRRRRRCRPPGPTPWRARPSRRRDWCRTGRRGRGAPCACRPRASGRRFPAARPAAALQAG